MFNGAQYLTPPPSPRQIAPSAPDPQESERWVIPEPYTGTPDPIPDELRNVAPLRYGFEFTDAALAAYERHHGLPETTGKVERFTQKLVLLAKHADELDIRLFAFLDPGAGCRATFTPNGSREDILYFVSRDLDGQFVGSLCPTADRIKSLGQALCIEQTVHWIPV